jgi:hypothetical protein
MFHEVHRHLLLYRKLQDGHTPRFRHIIVVKSEIFEVRILDRDVVQLDPEAAAEIKKC